MTEMTELLVANVLCFVIIFLILPPASTIRLTSVLTANNLQRLPASSTLHTDVVSTSLLYLLLLVLHHHNSLSHFPLLPVYICRQQNSATHRLGIYIAAPISGVSLKLMFFFFPLSCSFKKLLLSSTIS